MNIEYSVGLRQLPCGTPLSRCMSSPMCCPSLIRAVLPSRKLQRSLVKHSWSPKELNFSLSPLCHTLSKALETSLSTILINILSAAAFAADSYSTFRAVCVPRPLLKPCCLLLYNSWSSRNVTSLEFSIFSKTFPGNSSKDIALLPSTRRGLFPSLGIRWISATLNFLGKYPADRQALNISPSLHMTLFGAFSSIILLIPLNPGALPFLKLQIVSLISLGVILLIRGLFHSRRLKSAVAWG